MYITEWDILNSKLSCVGFTSNYFHDKIWNAIIFNKSKYICMLQHYTYKDLFYYNFYFYQLPIFNSNDQPIAKFKLKSYTPIFQIMKAN